MKHLKTFEEEQTYNGAMKNMYDVEPDFTPPFESGSEDEVIQRYVANHPEFSDFFNNFLDRFPDKETFDERLWDYIDDEDEYDEDESDEDEYDEEEEFGKRWSPEGEVNMLESEVDGQYPGDEIWPEFFTDLSDTEWNTKK